MQAPKDRSIYTIKKKAYRLCICLPADTGHSAEAPNKQIDPAATLRDPDSHFPVIEWE